MNHTVHVTLPSGLFEIEYTDELEAQIRARYFIPDEYVISVEMVKSFIEQELRTAIAKVDNEQG